MSSLERTRHRLGPCRPATVLLGLVLVLSGCGTTETTESTIPVGFPTIAPAALDGVYEITAIAPPSSGANTLQLVPAPTVELDVVTGTLSVDTACNRHLGSYSLDEDGRASFTVTGGTVDQCQAEIAAQDELLLEVLAAIDQWVESDGGLTFTGAAGSMSWTRS